MPSAELAERVSQLVDEGLPVVVVARRFGVGPHRVRAILRDLRSAANEERDDATPKPARNDVQDAVSRRFEASRRARIQAKPVFAERKVETSVRERNEPGRAGRRTVRQVQVSEKQRTSENVAVPADATKPLADDPVILCGQRVVAAAAALRASPPGQREAHVRSLQEAVREAHRAIDNCQMRLLSELAKTAA
ncbi:MAG: hypothetical protein ACOCYR_08305 [Erythrobacter sp.]